MPISTTSAPADAPRDPLPARFWLRVTWVTIELLLVSFFYAEGGTFFYQGF